MTRGTLMVLGTAATLVYGLAAGVAELVRRWDFSDQHEEF